jgi:3-methyladenine DNA glycosylase/8-oxoguanine DNA glycosylase
MYDNDTGEPFLVEYVGKKKEEPSNQAMDACRDLFDIDASYTHRYGHVNIQMDDTIATFFG